MQIDAVSGICLEKNAPNKVMDKCSQMFTS